MTQSPTSSILHRVSYCIKSITRDTNHPNNAYEAQKPRPSESVTLPLPTAEECDNALRNSRKAHVGCRTPIDIGGPRMSRFTEGSDTVPGPALVPETLRKGPAVKNKLKARIFNRKWRNWKATTKL